ncbi:Tripartite tricarboxylate transporter substrate binding protein [Cupriavidus sp. H18C1]
MSWTAGAVLAAALPGIGQAETYPARPVRLVVPQAGGTGNDVLARALAERLGHAWKQAVVVENKPGANGALAINYVLSQPADGYTLFFAGVSNLSFNPHLYPKLPYRPSKDLVGVAMLANSPFVFVAAPSLGVKTLQEFVQMAKARPGEISFASGGVGNSTHLAMELVAEKAGIKLQHVPFNGPGGATSLMNGQTPGDDERGGGRAREHRRTEARAARRHRGQAPCGAAHRAHLQGTGL